MDHQQHSSSSSSKMATRLKVQQGMCCTHEYNSTPPGPLPRYTLTASWRNKTESCAHCMLTSLPDCPAGMPRLVASHVSMLLLRCVGSYLQLPQTGIVVSQCSFLPACCGGLVPDCGFERLDLLYITQQQGHATHLSCLGKSKMPAQVCSKVQPGCI